MLPETGIDCCASTTVLGTFHSRVRHGFPSARFGRPSRPGNPSPLKRWTINGVPASERSCSSLALLDGQHDRYEHSTSYTLLASVAGRLLATASRLRRSSLDFQIVIIPVELQSAMAAEIDAGLRSATCLIDIAGGQKGRFERCLNARSAISECSNSLNGGVSLASSSGEIADNGEPRCFAKPSESRQRASWPNINISPWSCPFPIA